MGATLAIWSAYIIHNSGEHLLYKVIQGNLMEASEVRNGICQGYLLLLFPFILAMTWHYYHTIEKMAIFTLAQL
jgi:hypothetical protein